jgi:dipeptidyl-peptidase 4
MATATTAPITWGERYALAQSALMADDSVFNGAVYPTWIDRSHFWYERRGPKGVEYRIVDAEANVGKITLTLSDVADKLAKHLGAEVDPKQLMLRDLRFDIADGKVEFSAFGDSYALSLNDGLLSSTTKRADLTWSAAPDGKAAMLVRDWNLWRRDLDSGEESSLTKDGSEYFAYSTTPASMRVVQQNQGGMAPQGIWSPDSRFFLTLQVDDRQVPDLAVAEYAPLQGVRPNVTSNKTSLPGDPKVTEFRMIAVEATTGRQIEARYPRLSAVRMNDTPFAAQLAWWSADSLTAYFVDIERGEKAVHVVAFDIATGTTRIVFSETSPSYVELSVNVYAPALIYPLPESNELVWYSERSGHGHLYLYDLVTGALKTAITQGPWQIRDVVHIDAPRREVFFLAAGIAPDENPYICKPCRASIDGGSVKVLSDAPGNHSVWRRGEFGLTVLKIVGVDVAAISGRSPGGDFFVETVGAVDGLPRTYLRDRDGKEIALLEQAHFDAPSGWSWPEPVVCKAADGVTDTFGVLFKPFGYDPSASYPIIDYIYGGPQVSNTPQSSFAAGGVLTAGAFLEGAHLSALGAFVLILDGRGTANREQAFRTASYGAAQTASNLEDHIAAIRQLANTRGQIDLERVGITGFSGGGYMTALAALRFGEFFKVAVAGGGNYDQGLFWHCWGERYHGPYDPDHYATQAAKTYAGGLTGKLLLVHGLMDTGCHPAALFQLLQALIDAGKDPDLVILPRAGHDWTGYGVRRRLDYFVTHLFGETPPPASSFTRSFDLLIAKIAANAARPKAKVES